MRKNPCRTEGELLVFVDFFLRWEAVFRREREKLISDRADIFFISV